MKLLSVTVGLLSAFLLSVPAMAQDQKGAEPVFNKAFTVVEQQPEYPGGQAAMMDYIAKNMRYPEEAMENNIEGRVFVSFIVDTMGQVSNVEVEKGVQQLNAEAVRVIRSLQKFSPAKQAGRPVNYKYILPISFKLQTQTVTDQPPQSAPEMLNGEEIFTMVEQVASFPGGEAALQNYIVKNTRYPKDARKAGIEGRVILTMVVDKEGKLHNVKVMRGIGGGLDEEAVRLLKESPQPWMPAKQNGRPVNSRYTVPVTFRLR